MKRGTPASPTPFVFHRNWRGGDEPHVLIAGNSRLEGSYNVADADVIEVPYSGGGWDKFMHRAGDALSLGNCSEVVFIEVAQERSASRPIVIYVGNASALARDCGEELVQFIAQWEEHALGPARPMYLVLQFPSRQLG
jgi:hypothetical protein